MDPTPDLFCQLFQMMRDGRTVSEASSKIEELLHYPNSYISLLTILQPTYKIIFRKFACAIILSYLRIFHEELSSEILFEIRKMILSIFKQEESVELRSLYIEIISYLMFNWNDDWPALSNFIFVENKDLLSELQLLVQYVKKLDSTSISQNINFFFNLIHNGLQNPETLNYALQLISSLCPSLEDTSGLIQFQEPIYKILCESLSKNDSLFFAVTDPIISCINSNLILIPFELLFPIIVSALENPKLSADYRFKIHCFLLLFIESPVFLSSVVLDEKTIENMIDLEISMALLYFDLDDEDTTTNCLEDITIFLNRLFLNMPQTTVWQIITTKTHHLLESHDMIQLGAALIILERAIIFCHDESEKSISQLFPLYMFALTGSPSLSLFACRSVTNLAPYFSQMFINSSELLFSSLNILFNNYQSQNGSYDDIIWLSSIANLCISIVDVIDNCDPFFDDFWGIAMIFIFNNNGQFQSFGISIMTQLLSNSPFHVHVHFDTIFNNIQQIMNSDRKSLPFDCLSVLSNKESDIMKTQLPVLLSAFEYGITYEPSFIVLDSIYAFQDIISDLMPEIEPYLPHYYEIMINMLKNNLNSSENKNPNYLNSLVCALLECLSKIVSFYNIPKLIFEILTFIFYFSIFSKGKISAIKSFTNLSEQLQSNILETIPPIDFSAFPDTIPPAFYCAKDSFPIYHTPDIPQSNTELDNLRILKEAPVSIYQAFTNLIFLCIDFISEAYCGISDSFQSSCVCFTSFFKAGSKDLFAQPISLLPITFPSIINSLKDKSNFSLAQFSLNVFMDLLKANKSERTNEYAFRENIYTPIIQPIQELVKTFPHLWPILKEVIFEFFNDPSITINRYGIELISGITSCIAENDPDCFVQIANKILFIIQEQPAKIASSATNFILSAIHSKACSSYIVLHSNEISNLLINRLKAVLDLKEMDENNILLKDYLTASICVLASTVIGDHFPFNEVLPFLFRALPLSVDSLVSDVFIFLTTINSVYSDENYTQAAKSIIQVFAHPNNTFSQIKLLPAILISSMKTTLKTCFAQISKRGPIEQFISLSLDNDPYKIACFNDSWNILQSMEMSP